MKRLTPRLKTVLVAIAAASSELSSKQLADQLGFNLNQSTLGSILFELRQRGLVESPAPGIQRITAAGRAALDDKPAMAIDVATPDAEPTPATAPIMANLEALVHQIAGALATRIAEQTVAELRNRLQLPHVQAPSVEKAADDVSSLLAKVLADSRKDETPVTDHLSQRVAGQVTRLPIVTLVGLLPGQARMITSEYGQRIHLRFVGNEHQQPKRLEQLCQTSYAVIAMTGFISHSVFDMAKAASKNFCAIKGGMSSVRMHLDAILKTTDQQETA